MYFLISAFIMGVLVVLAFICRYCYGPQITDMQSYSVAMHDILVQSTILQETKNPYVRLVQTRECLARLQQLCTIFGENGLERTTNLNIVELANTLHKSEHECRKIINEYGLE